MYATDVMKTYVRSQIIKVLKTHNDIYEMFHIMELTDFRGRNCYWYFKNYELYEILDAKIMDKFISTKWDGDTAVNSHWLAYST